MLAALLVISALLAPPIPTQADRMMELLAIFETRLLSVPAARLAKLNRVRVDAGKAPITVDQLRGLADAWVAADERDAYEVRRRVAVEQGQPVAAAQWAAQRDDAEARRVAAMAAAAPYVIPHPFEGDP